MTWEPSTVSLGDWGYFQIVVDGKDVTYFRDAPVKIVNAEFSDPFDDASLTLEFPQITPFDLPGRDRTGQPDEETEDLSWFDLWKPVDIWFVPYDYPTTDKSIYWQGMVASFHEELRENNSAITVECVGAIYQLDLYVRAPLFMQEPLHIEYYLKFNFEVGEHRPHLKTQELIVEDAIPDTSDFYTWKSGSWNKLGTEYIQELLGFLVDDAGESWTIQLDYDRQPVLRKRDGGTIWNVYLGARGYSHSLALDGTKTSNVFYGSGTDEGGTRWVSYDENGFADPLAYDDTVHPNDSVNFNRDATRVETYIDFGAKISKAEGINFAEKFLAREKDPEWSGSITLKSDPAEGSKFEVRSGDTIRLHNWHRNTTTDFYVAKARHNFENVTSEFTVSTRRRSYQDVVDRIKAGRQAKLNPAKLSLKIKELSTIVDDEKRRWDYSLGAGYVPRTGTTAIDAIIANPASSTSYPPSADTYDGNGTGTNWLYVPGGDVDGGGQNWAATEVLLSEVGSVRSIFIAAYDASGNRRQVPFHVSVFSGDLGTVTNRVTLDGFDPFEDGIFTPDEYGNPGQVPPGLIIGWGAVSGGTSQRAGYFPGLESAGDSVTGYFEDSSSWTYKFQPGFDKVWLAIYCPDGAYFHGRLLHGVQQS